MNPIFTVIFFVALFVFIGYAILAVYHGMKFRYVSTRTKKATALFLILSVITGVAAVVQFLSF